MNREKQHISVLLIEDNPDYAELIRGILRRARDVTIDCRGTETLSSAFGDSAERQCDIAPSDLFLPDSEGLGRTLPFPADGERSY